MTGLLGILESSTSTPLTEPPTLVSQVTGSASAGSSFTVMSASIPMPSGLVAGNDLFVWIGGARGNSDPDPSFPGFTKVFDSRLVNGTSRGYLFLYRKPDITGSETATTFSQGVNGAAQIGYHAMQWSGVGAIEVPDPDGIGYLTGGTFTMNSNLVDTGGPDRVILSAAAGRGPNTGEVAEVWGGGATVMYGTPTGYTGFLTTARETVEDDANRTHTCQITNTQGGPASVIGSVLLLPEAEGVTEWNGPTYVPTDQQEKFNLDTGAYNFHAGNTARLLSSLEGADTGLAEHLVIGNSLSEGWTSLNGVTVTEDRLHAFPLMYRDAVCAALGIPVAGTGHVRCRSTQLVEPYRDARWNSNTTNQLIWQNGFHIISANDANDPPIVFTSDKAGSRVNIYAVDRPAGIEVSIDGGAPFVIAGGGTDLPITHTIGGLANTTHTVSIHPATNTLITIGGAGVRNDVGLVIHNVAQGGSRLGGTAQDSWTYTANGVANMLPFYSHAGMHGGADVVFIELGNNDLQSDQQTEGELQPLLDDYVELAAAFPNSDVVFINCIQGGEGFDANYPLFWEMFFDLATTMDWPVIDMQYILGGYDNMVAQGWTTDPYGHLTTEGATYFGEAVAQAVLTGVGLF